MIGHAAIGIASDIAISQAQKAVARKLERDVKLKERVTGLMHGFSPRGRALVRPVTPEPSQAGSKSQVATTSIALSSDKSEEHKRSRQGLTIRHQVIRPCRAH